MIQTISDENNGVQLLHAFTYDAYGNPLTETIQGNLTGKNQRNPMVGNDQKVAHTGCESYVKNVILPCKLPITTKSVKEKGK